VADAVKDGTDASAEFVIVPIVEALKIDFIQIKPRTDVFQNLGRAVAIGHEAGHQSRGLGFFEYCDGPLTGDQGLVVSADQDFCALIECISDQGFGRNFQRRRDRIWIADGLRCDPILAVGAVKIASEHAKAVGERTGIRVKKGLLLDGIALHAGGVSPRNVQLASAVEADFADSRLALGDWALMAAGEAADAILAEIFDERRIGFAGSLVEDFTQGGHGTSCVYFSAAEGC
jgi:hypothetical protein